MQHFPKVSEKKEKAHIKLKLYKKKKAKNKYIVIKPKELFLTNVGGGVF